MDGVASSRHRDGWFLSTVVQHSTRALLAIRCSCINQPQGSKAATCVAQLYIHTGLRRQLLYKPWPSKPQSPDCQAVGCQAGQAARTHPWLGCICLLFLLHVGLCWKALSLTSALPCLVSGTGEPHSTPSQPDVAAAVTCAHMQSNSKGISRACVTEQSSRRCRTASAATQLTQLPEPCPRLITNTPQHTTAPPQAAASPPG